jgi:ribonuclease HI
MMSAKKPKLALKTNAILYFDGAAKPNPGKAGAGWCLVEDTKDNDENGPILACGYHYIGDDDTNNVAEYQAFIGAMEHVLKTTLASTTFGKLTIRGDSMLVVNHVLGKWKCKQTHLLLLRETARSFFEKVKEKMQDDGDDETDVDKRVLLEYIPRDLNTLADHLSNVAVERKDFKSVVFPREETPIQTLKALKKVVF